MLIPLKERFREFGLNTRLTHNLIKTFQQLIKTLLIEILSTYFSF